MNDTAVQETEVQNDDVQNDEAQAGWDRKQVADSLVARHAALAAGAGLVPAVGFDVLAIGGVTLNLINRLSDLYGVGFSKQAGLNVIMTLLSSSTALALKTSAFSLIKALPLVGSLAGITAMPLVAGSIVYAVGQVMIRHYESGGDLLSFDASKAKAYFKQEVKQHQASAA